MVSNDESLLGLEGSSVELSAAGIVNAIIENGKIKITPIAEGNVIVKVKNGSNTAGILVKVNATFDISLGNIYKFTGNNQAPIVLETPVVIKGFSGQTVYQKDLTQYVVDLEGNALNFDVVSAPIYGSISLNPNGSSIYTSLSGENDTFQLKVSDNSLESIFKVIVQFN